MGGMLFSANCTSTTGPMTWTILPVFILKRLKGGGVRKLSGAELGGGDLEDFLRDAGLAGLVVLEREVAEQLRRVVLGRLHGNHARAVLGSLRLQRLVMHLAVEIKREQRREDVSGIRLKQHLAF